MLKKCLCIMIFNSRNAINMWDFREKDEGTAHSVYRLTCRHSITRVYNQGLVRTLPQKRKWHPTPVFFPGKFHGQRSLAGYSPWGHKRVRHHLATQQQQTCMMEGWGQAENTASGTQRSPKGCGPPNHFANSISGALPVTHPQLWWLLLLLMLLLQTDCGNLSQRCI